MSETKWTAGTWRYSGPPTYGGPCIMTTDGEKTWVVAACTTHKVWYREDGGPAFESAEPEAHANAHLIAAAPDLYAALEFVKAFFTKLEDGTDIADPLKKIRERYHAPVHAKIDAALAKARGEENQ